MAQIISHHEGRFLSLREINDWEFVTRPNATGVVGIFAFTTDRQVILVEQYRRPVKSRVLEICAGLIGDEEDQQYWLEKAREAVKQMEEDMKRKKEILDGLEEN